MELDPIESKLQEIEENEVRAAAADRELHQLLSSFCEKMRANPSAPFLSRAAATLDEEIEVAQGWCACGVVSEILGVRDVGSDWAIARAQDPSDYYVQGYEGLGICTDGRPVLLQLDQGSDSYHRQDAYAISEAAWEGSTCADYHRFTGFEGDPKSVLEKLASAFAQTLRLHEGKRSGAADTPSPERAPQATALLCRIERGRQWGEWEERVADELARIDDPVERVVRMVSLVDYSLPKPWGKLWRELCSPAARASTIDLMDNPPWDHAAVVDWFLRKVEVSPSSFKYNRLKRGRWGGSRWTEVTEQGWDFPMGSTEKCDSEESWSAVVIMPNGELRRRSGEAMPAQVGLNGNALRRMGELARLPSLPAHPTTATVDCIDPYRGRTSTVYEDGAEVVWDVDFEHV